MSRLARIKEIVLLLTALGIPLVFLGKHEDEPFNVPKLSLLTAGVALASGLHLCQVALGYRTVTTRSVIFPAMALTVPLTLAWATTPYREWALLGTYSRFTGLMPYIAFSLLGVLLVDAFRDNRDRFAWGLASVGAVVGLYAFLQALGVDPMWAPGTDAGSPFPPASVGHYNFAGGLLAISLPFAVYLWSLPGSSRWGMVTTIATTLGLIMTNSQGAWIAGLAGVAIMSGAALSSRWSRAPQAARSVVAILALLLVVGVAISTIANRPPLGGTAKSRGLLWGTALDMAAASPLTGRGPASYAVEGVRNRPLEYILLEPNSIADDPHSVPLAFFANAGALGALGFLALAVWIWRRGSRLQGGDMLGAAFFAGCAAYLMQSLVSIDELTLRAALWCSIAGLALSSPLPSRAFPSDVGRPSSRWKAGAAIVLAVGIMTSGVAFATGLVGAHRRVAEAKDLFASGDIARARASFEEALGFRFEPHYIDAYARHLAHAAMASGGERTDLIERMTEVYTYLDRFPAANGFIEAARAYRDWGHYEPAAWTQAKESLQRARPLDPENPEIDILMSEVLLAEGSPSAARDVLEPWAARLSGHMPGFWGTLGLARTLAGDQAAGETALDHALSLGAQDCRVLVAKGVMEEIGGGEISNPLSTTLGLNCPAGNYLLFERLGANP